MTGAGGRPRKVVRLVPHAPAPARWAPLVGRPGGPTRVAVGTALTLPGLPPPRCAAVEVVWFGADDPAGGASGGDEVADGGGGDGAGDRHAAAALLAADEAMVVPVDEVVARGAEALAVRWSDGGARFKMMSFGRRSAALTRDEFTRRWRAEAGRLGGERIPDDVRGLAYVQDHPLGDDPPLDAINEVWFDRLDDLRRRAEWFAARPLPAGLVAPDGCWSAYLREELVTGSA